MVASNANSGISNISNVRGVIVGNTVVNNGSMTNPDVWPGNGIGVSALLMATQRTAVLVERNEVHGNANDGIQVTTLNNRILNNNAADNAANGQLNFDLKDFSDADGDHVVDGKCNSVWYGNTWGSAGYYPDCVTKGGTGPNPRRSRASRARRRAPIRPPTDPRRRFDSQGARFAGERPVRYA